MYALISSEEIQLPSGAVVRLPATWQEYQTLCQQRGDGSIPRMKYRDGEVLLMSPREHVTFVNRHECPHPRPSPKAGEGRKTPAPLLPRWDSGLGDEG